MSDYLLRLIKVHSLDMVYHVFLFVLGLMSLISVSNSFYLYILSLV